MAHSLSLAIPSKGRLQDQVRNYFADAGLPIGQAAGGRGYRAALIGFPEIDVHLASASEIADALLSGDIHLGITGEDLIREAAPLPDGRVALLMALGFGFADVVVAVPQAWIDVSTMTDLDDVCAAHFQRHRRRLRIATKYTNLTRTFFGKAGIWDYRIVESAGATEGAPSSGAADAVVDISTTGATLAANGLKTLGDGTILQSQAQLAAGLACAWNEEARACARSLLARLAARERAKASLVLRARLEGDPARILAKLRTDARASVLSSPARGNSAGEYAILCPRESLMGAIAILQSEGNSGAVTSHEADYAFDSNDPHLAALENILPR